MRPITTQWAAFFYFSYKHIKRLLHLYRQLFFCFAALGTYDTFQVFAVVSVMLYSFHPSSGGNPALKGRVFQKWIGVGAKPTPTTKIPGLKAWVHKVKHVIIFYLILPSIFYSISTGVWKTSLKGIGPMFFEGW